ncbi:MAG: metallophosphoesterase [Dehalococcoidales bacterium]|nr:metallophosphoesterase [Dehalococcoidales bacterium]
MKKSITTILAFTGVVLVFASLAWAFSLHGTIGLFRVNGFFQLIFILGGVLALVLLLLTLLYLFLKHRGKTGRLRLLSVAIIIMSLPAIIMPITGFSYLSGIFSPGIGDTPPQLFIAAETGAYGIPDMAVTFNTKTNDTNTLKWGYSDMTVTQGEETASKQHVFMMNDLKPDTRYWYQVDDSAPKYFKTPSIDGQIRFAVASDAHFGAGNARNDLTAKMLAEIANPDNGFDMFFYLGDLVEYGFQDDQWQEAFQALSNTTSVIPTLLAAGNHDTLFSGFGNYKDYCSVEGIDSQTDLWYRVDVGNVHFLFLDLEWSAESYTPAQAAWLESQLESIPADDWTIVMGHGFYYASGSEFYGWNWYDNPETIDTITPMFNEYGVDLVFSGHVHQVELLQNSEVTYAICGSFGGIPDPEPDYTSPSSLWYMSGQYAFIDVLIESDLCTLTFRNSDFESLYKFTLGKNPQ